MRAARRLLAIALAWSACGGATASSFLDSLKDPEDGAFDMSEWLLDRKGFLPIPIVITEPAVGYGGGVALVFFRETLRAKAMEAKSGNGKIAPPDILAVAAIATENGTKGAAAGGMLTFLDDRWRYRGGVAKVSPNLEFFGVGGRLGNEAVAIGYNLDGWISSQEAMRRMGESDLWLVGRWYYFDLKSRFDLGQESTGLSDRELASKSSGLGISMEYDSRDTIFTPSRGSWLGFDANFYDPSWGSDTTFQAYRAKAFHYMPLGAKDQLVMGLRGDYRTARGEVPFYQLPFIDLRGVPAARYQDEQIGVVEIEARWNVTPRWALIGFAGAGRAWGRNQGFGDTPTRTAGGVGFRYLVARRMGLYAGIDYARSAGDDAWYLQFGSAWR